MNIKKRIDITKRGYRLLGKYCPGLIRAKVLAVTAATILPFAAILFSARIINEIAGEKRTGILILYVCLTIGLTFVFHLIKNAFERQASEKEAGMWNYFSKIFSDKQMSMDFADLEDVTVQKKRQKAQENLFMFGNGLAQLVWDTTGLVEVFVGIVASVSLTFTLFVSKTGNGVLDSFLWIPGLFLIMALAGIINSRFRKKENEVFEKWMDGTVWYNRTFMFYGHELYSNIARAKDVRLYRQDFTADREMQKLEDHNLKDNASLAKMSGYKGKTVLVLGVANALCYMYVVAKAGFGAFAVGSIVQYVGALMKLIESITEMFEVVSENRIYTEHLDKLYDYLDIDSERHEGNEKIKEDPQKDLTIEFKDVSFKYPGTENFVLKNISTKLKIGKKQAFVGANGAGKTTFVKLLCRLYDPTKGQILLNGKDIKEYDLKEYMKLFSFVFQDFKIFAFPLGQNISADLSYDKEKALECIKKVSLSDRYEKMEDGLETYLYKDVSEKGVNISGGEAQKIALARALYKDAPIIVLDEPTAALDPIAEAQVYSDFNSLVNNKTAVYISHRLSSCQFCDEILVFDKGEIVQRGTHNELVNDKGGKYFELWNAQAQYYK
ncbi:MAG: ABC transporter ATP-binding protein/permease [Lachnospiraceae bacterium]|nr:ABC transporter ATP-binding protein/permease [Lachnospiraceae bacterium]